MYIVQCIAEPYQKIWPSIQNILHNNELGQMSTVLEDSEALFFAFPLVIFLVLFTKYITQTNARLTHI